MEDSYEEFVKFLDSVTFDELMDFDEINKASAIDMLCERSSELLEMEAHLLSVLRHTKQALVEARGKHKRIRSVLEGLIRAENPYRTKHWSICQCLNRGTLTTQVFRREIHKLKKRSDK